MGLFDSNTLKFDVDEIKSMRQKLQGAAADLKDCNDTVKEGIEKLRNEDWKTPAGKKFMENVNTDWSEQVEKYVKVLNTLDELLGVAELDYSAVEEEVERATF